METQKKTNITEIEKRLEEIRAEKEELLQAASEIEGAYLSSYEIRMFSRLVKTLFKINMPPLLSLLRIVMMPTLRMQ